MQELKCTNCGGTLNHDATQVLIAGDITIVRAGNTLTCEHCGARFEQGHEFAAVTSVTFDQRGQTVGSQVNVGGAMIAVGRGIAQVRGGGSAAVVIVGGKR